ncbi:MAG TPA: CPBP family glutamic-type intramembrane protease [Chloroflexota bacterium]|nr:CPBP family glutamic-type intramembrane protease [Chloroflexota bacterium]
MTLVPISLAVTATVLVVLGALTALGEELGWRGFLVPELARSLILFADYNAGTPAWYSVACFNATVVSIHSPSALSLG